MRKIPVRHRTLWQKSEVTTAANAVGRYSYVA